MTRRTERACDHHAAAVLQRANVVGIAGGDDAVLVFVTEKLPLAALDRTDVVPSLLDGQPTDVIEVGRIEAKIGPGTSIGLADYGTGTCGAVVEDSRGRRFVLTNNHVAAATNAVPVLTPVHSPGPADGLGPVIGKLGRYEPISWQQANKIDAALVRLFGKPGRTHPRLTLTPRVGWRVSKRGRTTGKTYGTVIGRNATIDVWFGENQSARFTEQIVTTQMLEPGDSGSVLCTVGGFACGLSFAGSDGPDGVSLHNPIREVLATLSVHM